MSHIVKVAVKMTNKDAIIAAAEHLKLRFRGEQTHRVFGQNVKGLGFDLPNWEHPIVINTETGEASYDNYNERWGKQLELDKLVQRYSAEVVRMDAEQRGFQYNEQELENGDLQVELVSLN